MNIADILTGVSSVINLERLSESCASVNAEGFKEFLMDTIVQIFFFRD